MNINEIKTEWIRVNQKLATTDKLNEKLIQSMLKERSRSRVSKIRRENTMYMVLMILNLVLIAAIFWGNPFDFKYTAQYIPYGLLAIGVLMAIVALIKSFQSFNVDINNMSLENFLTKTLYEYEKNKKIETWFGRIILSAGLLTAFSFLPKKLENKDLWQALTETAGSIIITLVIYFVAFKAGAFKNRKKEGFENDLNELNELKGIAVDLKE
ncbi:MAG TPA: hypothetical protein VEZ55_04470 [Chitinophagaceae bacterium]|nr:hypothetical protein [Chitinophagaceae bacterium]